MKKILLLCLTLCLSIASFAQELPYSKYLNYNKEDFKENNFKFKKKANVWYLDKIDGLNMTLNILSIIADSEMDVRPDEDDYSIIVQLGRNEEPAYVRVIFYNDETYHKLLTFVKTHCQNIVDVTSGKIVKYLSSYDEYDLELIMEQHIISKTSSRTSDSKAVKTVDESYNEYEFIIRTDVEPWSKEIEKEAEKKAKRDAKGQKKQSVDELM